MKYKIVDKKAPRFTKTKYQTKLSIDELHEEFIAKTGSTIDLKAFRAMYEENMSVIRQWVATERNGVILPEQMGNLHLAFFKLTRPSYNYMEGMKSGEAPVNQMFETDFLQGKIYWDYKALKYKPRDYGLFGFKACRQLSQAASQAFLTIPERFPRYIYRSKTKENRKSKKLERDERNNQRSNQSVEGPDQGDQL